MSCEANENLKQSCIDAVMLYTDEDLIREFQLGKAASAVNLDALRDTMIEDLYQHRLAQQD